MLPALRSFPLYSLGELPAYRRGNANLLRGYRRDLSLWQSLESVLHYHNESFNIWTHAAAVLWLLWTAWHDLTVGYIAGAPLAMRAAYTFFISCHIYLYCGSTAFHVFHAMGKEHYRFFAKCDYSGIALAVAGIYLPLVFYSWYCMPVAQAFYGLLVAVASLLCYWMSFWDSIESQEKRTMRVLAFTSLGFIGVAMIPHGLLVFETSTVLLMAEKMLICGAVFFVGMVVYAFQIPERLFPGMFDYSCHSHCIWHCILVLGTYKLYWLMHWMYEFEQHRACT
mmetsp:Transcript_5819/g.22695  ORF Transcript_5819/g.22695 Transcript_5819/m.22695 type:complete len:281 (-) Transcript_5819:1888-2730(-)